LKDNLMELLVLWTVSVMGCGVCGWAMGGLVSEDIRLLNELIQRYPGLGVARVTRDGLLHGGKGMRWSGVVDG